MKAKVECGTVVWSDEIDIAPEHLYEYSRATLIKVALSIWQSSSKS